MNCVTPPSGMLTITSQADWEAILGVLILTAVVPEHCGKANLRGNLDVMISYEKIVVIMDSF